MNLVVFDIDGTLTETTSVDSDCFVRALTEVFGLKDVDADWPRYENATDSGVLPDIHRMRTGRGPSVAEARRFRQHFVSLLTQAWHLWPFAAAQGAAACLEALSESNEYRVSLATGVWRDSARLKMASAGMCYDDYPSASADDSAERETIIKLSRERATNGMTCSMGFTSAKHFDWMSRIMGLGIALLGLVTVARAEDLGALVDKMVAAYGGQAALEKIVAIREVGKVEATMRVGSSGPIVRTYARPAKLRIQIGDGPKFTEVRALNGVKGWRNGQETTGVAFEAMLLQAARLDLPWLLMKDKSKLVDKGNVERDGRQLHVLELPLENGLLVSAGIELTTGHILFSSGTTRTGSMTFETSYDDLRKVEGVLFAFKETNMAQGTKTAETILSNIEVLKEAPEDAFKP